MWNTDTLKRTTSVYLNGKNGFLRTTAGYKLTDHIREIGKYKMNWECMIYTKKYGKKWIDFRLKVTK